MWQSVKAKPSRQIHGMTHQNKLIIIYWNAKTNKSYDMFCCCYWKQQVFAEYLIDIYTNKHTKNAAMGHLDFF